jgi:DnaJ-class molecular chaperone
MAGYNPNCNNCFKCVTCKGEGWVNKPKMDGTRAYYERATCTACNGAGGKPGAGTHNHG